MLLLTPWHDAARWVASGYAILITARSGWSMLKSLRTGTWGVDILAVAAIVATVVLGDYWAALVVVLTLMSGEALEAFAARRARGELTALMSRAPRVAHREQDGSVEDVPVDSVSTGDVLVVKPGEAVPVDSELLSDGAYFDESSIRGESLTVWVSAGVPLLSGSINADTVIRIRATTTAQLSQYQIIVQLVRVAADSKAPFVRLADRGAIPFPIGALSLGALAWLISGDPARLAEVLVVATPPLLTATPVAFIAGMSRAAARGVRKPRFWPSRHLSRLIPSTCLHRPSSRKRRIGPGSPCGHQRHRGRRHGNPRHNRRGRGGCREVGLRVALRATGLASVGGGGDCRLRL